jgi:DNA-binding MarR family transcriptional regulator
VPEVSLLRLIALVCSLQAAPVFAAPDEEPVDAPVAAPTVVPSAPPSEAVVRQEWVPALDARAETGRRKVDARRAFHAAEGPFSEAYPHLVGASLGDPDVVRGRLALLDDAAVGRAREVREAGRVPEGVATVYRKALQSAHEAEEGADALERRLLTGLLATLEAFPELADAQVEAERTSLLELREEATAELAAAGDDIDAQAAARRRLALIDRDLQRFTEVVQAVRLAGVGGAPPSPEPELERLRAGPPGLNQAALRLRLMLPFLAPEVAEQVEGEMAAFWSQRLDEAVAAVAEAQTALAGLEERTDWPTPEEAASQLERATRRLSAREAMLAAVPERGAADAVRLQVLAQRVEEAKLQLQLAEAEVSRATGEVDAEESAERAKTEAQAAQEAAERARAEATNARARRIADAKSDFADAQSRSAEVWALARDAKEAAEQAQTDWADQMADVKRRVQRVTSQGALDTDRVDPDVVFRDVRELLTALRNDESVRGSAKVRADYVQERSEKLMASDAERIAEVESLAAKPGLDGEKKAELLAMVDRWKELLEEERSALETLNAATATRRALGLRTLQEARLARRVLSDYISREARNASRAHLLTDITQELSLLGPSVVMMGRDRLDDLWGASSFLTDFNVLRRLFMGSIWTVVLVFGWWAARARTSSLSLQVAQRVRTWRPELRLSDVQALRDPTQRFLRNTVDLALGYSLIWSLGDTLPEIAFALLVYLQLSLYRVLLAGYDLLVVRNDEVRPALVALRLDTWRLARRTVQVFASFTIVRAFVRFLVWDVLGLDTIDLLLEWLLGWVFWGIVGWALWQWQPHLRERAQRYAQGHPAIAWLAQEDGSPLLRIPRAIGALGFFGVRGVVDLAYRGARDGSSLSWLLNLVNRYRLEDDASEEVRFLPEEVRKAICEGPTLDKHLIERVEVSEGVNTAVIEWKRTHRRGLVAIVGDRGAGKRTTCDVVARDLHKQHGLEVKRVKLDQRLTGEDEAIDWMAAALGIEADFDHMDELAAHMATEEPHAIVLEGVHRAFERRVGGLDAVQAILYLLNATSDRHFWVVSVHGPAWDWLDSVGSLIDTSVFRTVVRLAPLTSAQLKALTVARTGQQGFRVDFSGLVKASALGTDPEVELERSTSVFYRLLAEASSGNPTIAMRLWSTCLQPTDDPHVVTVRMGASLSAGVVANLSDTALFVLVALRLQDELSIPQLVDVTNLGVASVRSTVRDLLARGLVERCAERDDHVRIPDESLRAVSRTLRRRHFLHLGAA